MSSDQVSNACSVTSGGMKKNVVLFVLSHYRISPTYVVYVGFLAVAQGIV